MKARKGWKGHGKGKGKWSPWNKGGKGEGQGFPGKGDWQGNLNSFNQALWNINDSPEENMQYGGAWKNQEIEMQPESLLSTGQLLISVMYDVVPRSYGTLGSLKHLLTETRGDLATINHDEYRDFITQHFDGKGILELLLERGIEITTKEKDVLEKTGLLALAGTIKAIDQGRIPKGKRLLCCLTSGVSKTDGQAEPEHRIARLDPDLKEYINTL